MDAAVERSVDSEILTGQQIRRLRKFYSHQLEKYLARHRALPEHVRVDTHSNPRYPYFKLVRLWELSEAMTFFGNATQARAIARTLDAMDTALTTMERELHDMTELAKGA